MTLPELISAGRLHPLPGTFIARVDKVQQYGRLVLPPSAQYETFTATVAAVGPGLPDYLTPGVRVLPHTTSGRSVYEDSATRYVAYALADIQAVFLESVTQAEIDAYFGGAHDQPNDPSD